tara:strand:- start:181 stop:2154 length:1974 start_codon:yes stop_codon:yes gene_type:complete
MVYIVSSNISNLGEGVSTTGINDPARYSNQLSSTFQIEPNSEIAVESVKINRNGNVQLSVTNNQFNVYIGQDLNASALLLQQSGGFPVSTWIRGSSGGKTMTLSPSDLREKISYGLQAGLDQHPNYSATFNGSNTDFPRVNLLNGSGIFTGYQYLFNQNGCQSVSTRTGMTTELGQKGWVTADINQTDFSVVSAGASGVRVKKPSTAGAGEDMSAMYQALPMSLANGSVVFFFNSGANGSAGGEFAVGLSRASFNDDQIRQAGQSNPALEGIPEYYNEINTHGGYTDKTFFDWSLECDGDNKLHVYQACYSDDGAKYKIPNMDYDLEDYLGVKFLATGTMMTVFLIEADDGSETEIANGLSGNKLYNTKQIGITTQHLFPKINMYGPTSGARVITCQYDGVNMKTTDFDTDISSSYVYGGRLHSPHIVPPADLNGSLINGKLTYQDWWSWCWQTGQQGFAQSVDYRGVYDFRRNPADPVNPFNPDYRVEGLNGSGGIALSTVIIMSPDQTYNGLSDHTDQSSAQNIMGFEMAPTQTIKSQYTSASGSEVFMNSNSVPKMVSNQSLFVRLPNLPIESYNTGKGSLSKILFHLPRFDNAGAEVGGLFFQPADRLYIPLQNTNSFRLNNLQVELCNSDETQEQVDLVGQTVICFDIRKIR